MFHAVIAESRQHGSVTNFKVPNMAQIWFKEAWLDKFYEIYRH